jgi:hypothetical protein
VVKSLERGTKRRGFIGLRTVLLVLLALLLAAVCPWLLIPLIVYIAYKAGRWFYRRTKAIRWPKFDRGERRPETTSVIGDLQVYEVEGVGPALIVKNGIEALGLGCLEVKSLGGGAVAELLSAVDAAAKAGFESNLIVSRAASGASRLVIMVKARKPLTKGFQETAREAVDDVVRGLAAAAGAVKARLPKSEVQVLEFDELVKAVRGVVA